MTAMDPLVHIRRVRMKSNRLRKDRMFSDVTLICGEQRFACHRIILVTSSHFFDDVMLASNEIAIPVTIELDDMTGDIMEILLDFMYTGQINTQITDSDRMLRILTASHQLQVWGAAGYLCSYWLQRSPTKQFLLFWDWAEKYGDDYVRSKIVKHVAANFHSISQGVEFLRLSYPRLRVILSNKYCNVGIFHDFLLQAILKWVRHNTRGRENYLESLISFVDAEKLSSNCRQQLLEDKSWNQISGLLMRQGNASFDTKDSLEYLSEKGAEPEVDSDPYLKDDLPLPVIQMKYVGSDNLSPGDGTKDGARRSPSKPPRVAPVQPLSKKVSKDSSPSRNVTRIPSPPLARKPPSHSGFSSPTFLDAVHCHTGPALLIAGRGDLNQYLAFVYVPVCSSWSRPIEIPTSPMENRGFISHNGCLYFIGGEDNANHKLATFYVYDLRQGSLTQRPNMRVARSCAGIAQWNNMFFIAGGLSRFGQAMTHVEMYNVETDTWKLMPPLRHKRFNPGVAVINDHLYMIGGNTAFCESYDLKNDIGWQELVPLPDLFDDVGVYCAAHDNHIFAFRAFRPDKLCCLDPRRNEWRVVRTTGTPPKDLIGLFNFKGDLYTLERSGKLHVFDVELVAWQPSISVPRVCSRPLHLALLNLDAIK